MQYMQAQKGCDGGQCYVKLVNHSFIGGIEQILLEEICFQNCKELGRGKTTWHRLWRMTYLIEQNGLEKIHLNNDVEYMKRMKIT